MLRVVDKYGNLKTLQILKGSKEFNEQMLLITNLLSSTATTLELLVEIRDLLKALNE